MSDTIESPRFASREIKIALDALGLKAVAAIGRSPLHPLRVVSTVDVRLEVKRQQQMWPDAVASQLEIYAAPLVADRLCESVLKRAKDRGTAVRGAWVVMTATEIEAIVRAEAVEIGARILTADERLATAERWAAKKWG